MFGCPFTIFFARCYICPLIHNILCPLSSPVEIVDSIFLPVEVNNSTIELYLPVDSQCSSPVEALNLIVEPKPLPIEVPVEVNNSPIELHLPAEAKEKRAVVESKPSPFEVNNSIIELHLPVEAKENRAIIESKVKPSPVEVNNSTIEL